MNIPRETESEHRRLAAEQRRRGKEEATSVITPRHTAPPVDEGSVTPYKPRPGRTPASFGTDDDDYKGAPLKSRPAIRTEVMPSPRGAPSRGRGGPSSAPAVSRPAPGPEPALPSLASLTGEGYRGAAEQLEGTANVVNFQADAAAMVARRAGALERELDAQLQQVGLEMQVPQLPEEEQHAVEVLNKAGLPALGEWTERVLLSMNAGKAAFELMLESATANNLARGKAEQSLTSLRAEIVQRVEVLLDKLGLDHLSGESEREIFNRDMHSAEAHLSKMHDVLHTAYVHVTGSRKVPKTNVEMLQELEGYAGMLHSQTRAELLHTKAEELDGLRKQMQEQINNRERAITEHMARNKLLSEELLARNVTSEKLRAAQAAAREAVSRAELAEGKVAEQNTALQAAVAELKAAQDKVREEQGRIERGSKQLKDLQGELDAAKAATAAAVNSTEQVRKQANAELMQRTADLQTSAAEITRLERELEATAAARDEAQQRVDKIIQEAKAERQRVREAMAAVNLAGQAAAANANAMARQTIKQGGAALEAEAKAVVESTQQQAQSAVEAAKALASKAQGLAAKSDATTRALQVTQDAALAHTRAILKLMSSDDKAPPELDLLETLKGVSKAVATYSVELQKAKKEAELSDSLKEAREAAEQAHTAEVKALQTRITALADEINTRSTQERERVAQAPKDTKPKDLEQALSDLQDHLRAPGKGTAELTKVRVARKNITRGDREALLTEIERLHQEVFKGDEACAKLRVELEEGAQLLAEQAGRAQVAREGLAQARVEWEELEKKRFERLFEMLIAAEKGEEPPTATTRAASNGGEAASGTDAEWSPPSGFFELGRRLAEASRLLGQAAPFSNANVRACQAAGHDVEWELSLASSDRLAMPFAEAECVKKECVFEGTFSRLPESWVTGMVNLAIGSQYERAQYFGFTAFYALADGATRRNWDAAANRGLGDTDEYSLKIFKQTMPLRKRRVYGVPLDMGLGLANQVGAYNLPSPIGASRHEVVFLVPRYDGGDSAAVNAGEALQTLAARLQSAVKGVDATHTLYLVIPLVGDLPSRDAQDSIGFEPGDTLSDPTRGGPRVLYGGFCQQPWTCVLFAAVCSGGRSVGPYDEGAETTENAHMAHKSFEDAATDFVDELGKQIADYAVKLSLAGQGDLHNLLMPADLIIGQRRHPVLGGASLAVKQRVEALKEWVDKHHPPSLNVYTRPLSPGKSKVSVFTEPQDA